MRTILLATVFLLLSQIMSAQILYVDQSVSGGTGDGSSWVNALIIFKMH
ncbi:MAG: hypothetical protein AAGI23_07980 [Bacteroidota bacterium]